MSSVAVDLSSEADTDRLGSALAKFLPPGCTVNLNGTLGAGKTRLVKAIGDAQGHPSEEILSPTFTLCNEYRSEQCQIDHLDLYRIADDDELIELGLDEYCAAPPITFLEWGDRFASHLPDDRIDIQIEIESEQERRVIIKLCGEELSPLVESLKECLRQAGFFVDLDDAPNS